jgi:multicomponent Na+:H+ antiporter subunit D
MKAMAAEHALIALIFMPLLAATAAAVVPARGGRLLSCAVTIALPLLLLPLTLQIVAHGVLDYALAGLPAPLGIRLHLDGFSLLLLWLVALVMLAATAHAWSSIGAAPDARRFWPLWLMLLTGLNVILLSADLFNLYVGLELLTLSAVALVAYGGSIAALRAAMRYLLLAILASLVYLFGVALIYGASGTLDLELIGERLPAGRVQTAALILMSGGLLLKSAIFPLHGWLPPAHASAPGPVSAVLSGLVVKASLYLLYRLWFGTPMLAPGQAGVLLAALGAAAVFAGSLMALRQQRLKRVVAWSTVAQLGYLMLVFALPVTAAWQGSVYLLLSHGLAKAAMFLAAANMMTLLRGDRIENLPGADARLPVSVYAFGLAGVSLMGLPPSGGFLAKWQLLTAAWAEEQWLWVAVLLLGSLLAAAYLFRVLALMFRRPLFELTAPGTPPTRVAEFAALALALLAIAAGFGSAPLLALLPLPAGIDGAGP